MAIVLDRAQRSAVFDFVVSDVAEVGNLAFVLESGEGGRAEGLRRNFDQAARLLDQIGWKKSDSRERYEVEMGDADVLVRCSVGCMNERARSLMMP